MNAPASTTAFAAAPSERVPRRVQLGVLLAALFLIWNSLGDHALFPPDEGRYGSVSAWMAEHGDWLQPHLRDLLHVTKPPLTYWAQGLGVCALGRTELAVRLPSAIGATIVVLSMFWFLRRTCGPLTAVLAVGVYAVMPLPLIVGRLGTTDSMLNAWWWLALCFGYLALERGLQTRVGWLAALWGATALIGLTKGPLILAPIVLLCAWLVLGGRWREIRRTHFLLGLPLALAPLATAAYLYWRTDPVRTISIWHFEFIERITGSDKQNDPLLEFVPVFLGGFFPASAMMVLPWLNLSWRRTLACFCGGDLRALMLVAVVLPFIGFTALSGKQVTYILPLAAPLAALTGMMLRRWVAPRYSDEPRYRLPDVRVTGAVVMSLVAIGVPAAAAWAVQQGRAPAWAPGWTLVWWSLVFVPAALGWWACVAFWSAPARRGAVLACALLGTVAMWTGIQHVENLAMDAMSSRPLAQRLVDSGRPVLVCMLRNLTIDFYMGVWTEYTDDPATVPQWLTEHPSGVVVIAEKDVARARTLAPGALDTLRELTRADLWPMKRVLVLQR